MKQSELVSRVRNHADNAQLYFEQKNHQACHDELAKLRRFLNKQPDLKVGGWNKAEKSSNPSTMWEHLH